MVQQFGMDEDLGLAQTSPNQYGQSPFGSEIDGKAHAAVNKLLKASMERTEKRLREGADKHKAMIEALMTKETLGADEIQAIAHPKPK
jgi:ATP-dependent Zn protease